MSVGRFDCVFTAALAVCSEAYFSALSKMGDQALHTLSSHSLGETIACLYLKRVIPHIYILRYEMYSRLSNFMLN